VKPALNNQASGSQTLWLRGEIARKGLSLCAQLFNIVGDVSKNGYMAGFMLRISMHYNDGVGE